MEGGGGGQLQYMRILSVWGLFSGFLEVYRRKPIRQLVTVAALLVSGPLTLGIIGEIIMVLLPCCIVIGISIIIWLVSFVVVYVYVRFGVSGTDIFDASYVQYSIHCLLQRVLKINGGCYSSARS